MTAIRSQATLAPDTWHDVAVTFDGSNALLYLNGLAVATAPIIAPAQWSAPELRFGQMMTLSALGVWTHSGLLALYDFNQEAGYTASDLSGHDNHANLIGSWQWGDVSVPEPHLDWSLAGHNLLMSWPANNGFVLESAGSFTPPIVWTEVTDLTVQVIDGRHTVTANTSVGTRFFRLCLKP